MPENSPYRNAILSVFNPALTQKLALAEESFSTNLREAAEVRGRAEEMIHSGDLRQHPEHLEADFENEHAELIRHHEVRFVKRLKVLLEFWKDTLED